MENVVNGHTTASHPAVRLTPADLKTIYAVFIDRYEELDAVLRSAPSPQRRKEALVEKECVESIIRQICSAGGVPAPHEAACGLTLALVSSPPVPALRVRP